MDLRPFSEIIKEVVFAARCACSTVLDYAESHQAFPTYSLSSIIRFALTRGHILFGPASVVKGGSPKQFQQQCPDPQLSCRSPAPVKDTCCFNTPGGQLLQTQFWDSHPALGPNDSWTIHGLWPDNCDGTFESNCDPQRTYKNITQILAESNTQNGTLAYMGIYWKDLRGHDESLYEHEWSKHGTCINTLQPKCYTNYRVQEEVVTYFENTVELFKKLPSYTWLSDAGITPSKDRTYDCAAVEATLRKAFGHPVTLRCHRGELNEIWYHFNVKGGFDAGKHGGVDHFIPADPDGVNSSCPRHVKYIPKSTGDR